MPATDNNPKSLSDALYQIADELRAAANAGLRYSENGYDKERYHQILSASARLVAAVEHRPADEVMAEYNGNLAHLSPVLCVEAAVFREGKILLVQRRDDQTWAMPGGLAEVGETPAQAAERELLEEAGLRGKVIRLLGLFDTRRWPGRSRMQLYIALFLVQSEEIPSVTLTESIGPEAESLDVGFFAEDALPPLHPGHQLRVPVAFQLFRGDITPPYFDR